MSLIEVVGLSYGYGGRNILENVNLSVDEGEVFTLIGPTGAGKTTLLRLIDLLEVPSSGEIYFNGSCIPKSGKQRLEIRRRMAFVLQKPQLFNLSVQDNITYGLRWRGEKKNRIAKRIDRILEMIGLEAYRDRDARTLSGGEAQRVALARALVLEPEVLLLDEPTANLDPVSTEKIEQLISHIIEQRNITVIMATHDMPQGQQLADRIGVILNGEIVQVGGAKEIFNLPKDKEVADFVGMENIIAGRVVTSVEGIVMVSIDNNVIQAVSDYPVGEEVYAGIRPEDITLALSKSESSARNCFYGRVTRVTPLGPVSKVGIDCGFRLVALVTRVSVEELNLQEGKEVYVSFKATGVHLVEKKG